MWPKINESRCNSLTHKRAKATCLMMFSFCFPVQKFLQAYWTFFLWLFWQNNKCVKSQTLTIFCLFLGEFCLLWCIIWCIPTKISEKWFMLAALPITGKCKAFRIFIERRGRRRDPSFERKAGEEWHKFLL